MGDFRATGRSSFFDSRPCGAEARRATVRKQSRWIGRCDPERRRAPAPIHLCENRKTVERGLSAVRQNALRQTGSVKGVKDKANAEGGTRTSEVMGENKAGRSKTTPLQQTCGRAALRRGQATPPYIGGERRKAESVAAGFGTIEPPFAAKEAHFCRIYPPFAANCGKGSGADRRWKGRAGRRDKFSEIQTVGVRARRG